MEPSFAGAEKKLRRHDWERPMADAHRGTMLHGCASPLMFEAASCGPRFTISLKRSHLTAR
jgi:hypothetical protein